MQCAVHYLSFFFRTTKFGIRSLPFRISRHNYTMFKKALADEIFSVDFLRWGEEERWEAFINEGNLPVNPAVVA